MSSSSLGAVCAAVTTGGVAESLCVANNRLAALYAALPPSQTATATYAYGQYTKWRRAAYTHVFCDLLQQPPARLMPQIACNASVGVVAAVVLRATMLMDVTVRAFMTDCTEGDDGNGGNKRYSVNGVVRGHSLGAWAAACFWAAQKIEYTECIYLLDEIEHRFGAADVIDAEQALLDVLTWQAYVPTPVDLCALILSGADALVDGDASSSSSSPNTLAECTNQCMQRMLSGVMTTDAAPFSGTEALYRFVDAAIVSVAGQKSPSPPPMSPPSSPPPPPLPSYEPHAKRMRTAVSVGQ